MARYEFRFVVTDTELSEEHQQKVGRAIAEAGALAITDLTPPDAITVNYRPNQWWYGRPPEPVLVALGEWAEQIQVREEAGGETA